MTTTPLHEWGHLLGRGKTFHDDGPIPVFTDTRAEKDPQAVDRKGRPIFDADGAPENVYGFLKCRDIAKYRPAEAQIAPENYAYYAVAMYMKDWFWGKSLDIASDPKD